jgi:hypothetical protein
LGLPFLSHNNLVIDHALRKAVDIKLGCDLLNPTPPAEPSPLKRNWNKNFMNYKKTAS